MPKMTFIERDGTRKEVDAPLGLSVLEIAHKHGTDLQRLARLQLSRHFRADVAAAEDGDAQRRRG
jgi:hypothetical protein